MIFKRIKKNDPSDLVYEITLAPGEAFDLLQQINAETGSSFNEGHSKPNWPLANVLIELQLELTNAIRDLVLGMDS